MSKPKGPTGDTHSMTGYGRAQITGRDYELTVEIKSVNSRFREGQCRLPRELSFFEPKLHRRVQSRLQRGKYDLQVLLKTQQAQSSWPRLNQEAVDHYKRLLEQLQEGLQLGQASVGPSNAGTSKIPSLTSISDFFQLEGVLERDQDQDMQVLNPALEADLFSALDQATEHLVQSRRSEGEKLCQDLRSNLSRLEDHNQALKERLDGFKKQLGDKLKARLQKTLADLALQLDTDSPEFQQRLIQEMLLAVDKNDITEEVDRLQAHLTAVEDLLDQGGVIGRKLDFFCQEFHREVNTMASKLALTSDVHRTMDMKHDIEKIRQQVQNIE